MARVMATVDDTLTFFTEVDEVFLHLNDPAARVTNKIIGGDKLSFQIQIIRSKLNLRKLKTSNLEDVKISLSKSLLGGSCLCFHFPRV